MGTCLVLNSETDPSQEHANGVRYPRVGGTRQCRFAGTNFKPRKLLENAQTPTRRVHAVLGPVFFFLQYELVDYVPGDLEYF